MSAPERLSSLLPSVVAELANQTPEINMAERDQHFTNPPTEGLHLDCDQLASLKVLLDFAVPREPGSPTDWEGTGRRYHESIIGYRAPCTCPSRMQDDPAKPGCPVHDPHGEATPS